MAVSSDRPCGLSRARCHCRGVGYGSCCAVSAGHNPIGASDNDSASRSHLRCLRDTRLYKCISFGDCSLRICCACKRWRLLFYQASLTNELLCPQLVRDLGSERLADDIVDVATSTRTQRGNHRSPTTRTGRLACQSSCWRRCRPAAPTVWSVVEGRQISGMACARDCARAFPRRRLTRRNTFGCLRIRDR